MRGKRLSCWAAVAAWSVVGIGAAPAAVKPDIREAREVPDPEGPPIAVLEPSGQTATVAGGCDQIGDFIQLFAGIDRFRGNAYRVTRNSTLLSFEIELQFTGTVCFNFSVHRSPAGQQFPDYERVLPDAERCLDGTGAPAWYASDTLTDPNTSELGLELEAGFDYVIGAAWGAESVTYGRDRLTYPRPFSQGSVLGLVAENIPPPLPDVVSNVAVFGSGGHAMRLCFAGACCGRGPTGCEEINLGECIGIGEEATAPGVSCDEVRAEGCPLPHYACCTGPNECGGDFNRFSCEAKGGVSHTGLVCADEAIDPCAPRGRCCLPDGLCVPDVTEARCALLRGNYGGDGVTCAAAPCAGACCRAGQPCRFEVSRSVCESSGGGVFAGPGISCSPDDPCVPKGACCTGTGCQVVTQPDCAAAGGNYRGDETDCNTIVPQCGRGACCVSGAGCVDSSGAGVTQTLCSGTLGGTFKGDGSLCNTISPRCPGVCCWEICSDSVTPEDCASLPGRFAGYSGFCPFFADDPDPCGGTPPTTGACCLSDGGCTVTTLQLCVQSLKGSYKGTNTSCSTAGICPVLPVVGACCVDSPSSCTGGVTEAECTGRWKQAAVCDATICLRSGACCDRTNPVPSCTDVREDACTGLDQTFTADTTCDRLFPPCAPLGACCDINDFQCLDDVIEGACLGTGRTWDPGGTCNLFDPPCDPPVGACCKIVGPASECTDKDRKACETSGGVYRGDGTVCSAGACGACCQTTGLCEDNVFVDNAAHADACPAPRAFYTHSVCATACVAGGSCCLSEAPLCSDLFEEDCAVARGTFGGSGTDCRPNPCLSIVTSTPPDCGVDARQPVTLGGSVVVGSRSLDITFDGPAGGMRPLDFTVDIFPGFSLPPTITNVIAGPDADTVTLLFDTRIATREWTCVTHDSSGTRTCVGLLPADVNGNLNTALRDPADSPEANIPDLRALADCIAGAASCGLWSCDIDRSGTCTAADLLLEVDLLNGAGALGNWADRTMDPCPVLPTP